MCEQLLECDRPTAQYYIIAFRIVHELTVWLLQKWLAISTKDGLCCVCITSWNKHSSCWIETSQTRSMGDSLSLTRKLDEWSCMCVCCCIRRQMKYRYREKTFSLSSSACIGLYSSLPMRNRSVLIDNPSSNNFPTTVPYLIVRFLSMDFL